MGVRSSGLGSLRIIEPGGRVPVVCVSIRLGLLVRGKREESDRRGALEDLPRRPRYSLRFGSEHRCGRSLNEAGLHCDGKRFLQVKITTDPWEFPCQSSMCRDKHNVLQRDQLQKKKKRRDYSARRGGKARTKYFEKTVIVRRDVGMGFTKSSCTDIRKPTHKRSE